MTRAGTSGQQIYDVTFSGGPGTGTFFGLNPTSTWALNLWDNNTSGIENGLVSWTLDINTVAPVPEPVNVALGIFGMLFLAVMIMRRRFKKLAGNRPVQAE